MKRRSFIQKAGAAGFICFLDPLELVQTPGETPINNLEANFLTPTTKSYPYTYWFWMNGNISKEGITLDLEAMKRVGIAGVFNFDVGTGIPKGPIDYLSKEWLALKKHAMKECNRLGIEFTLHNCPGWSASGGPWITAELAMQQLSWSETYLAGGKTIHHRIPQPPSRLDYYRDIAVLAFPSLEGEELLQTMKARSPQGAVLPGQITGLDQDGAVVRPAPGETTAWLELEFNQPYEASMITFFISSPENNTTETKLAEFSERTSIILEASDDGSSFRRIVQIPTGLETELLSGNKFISFDFIPTKAKYFRLSSTKPRRYRQVQFSGITRLKNWMEKTNHRARYLMFVDEPSTISHTNNQRVPPGFIIDYNKIVVLTDHMDKEGMLNWEAPPGNWTILRIGYTPTGTLNRAAPQTGIGLECDKYSREAMRFHFKKITEQFIPEMKALAAKGKMGLEIDSYEAGTQNWTTGFEKEFFKKWNYELVKYMAILAGGRIVDSVDKTERFLWDFRQVQANMIANNYYGQFYELCKQHGIISYIEPYEMGPMEEMQIGAGADINVGEFWNGISSVLPVKHPARRTARLAASIAHINNQSIVGAEAFTAEPDSGKWQEHPFAMKAIGDKVFTQGVNRMIFHRFAHQPHPTAVPGMTMGPWGIHFDRTTTWWNQAKPWLRYLSRCQWLLQQGRMVADLVYFTGEDANMYTRVMPDELCPTPPAGYAYDLVNADSLLQAQVLNQELLLPNGSRYRVMVFQDYHALSLPLLRKLKDLVNQGLVMVGEKPTRSTGLANYHDGDTEFLTIVEELWKNIDGKSTKHTIGRGQVIWGQSLEKVLASLSPGPDFTASSGRGKPPVIYTHRQTAEAEIYFISNQKRSVEEITARFRVNGKQPELWDPASGNITKAIFYEPINGFTHVPLQLEPYGSVFVIFREPAINNPFVSLEKDETILITTRPLAYTPPLYADHQNSFSICFWAKPEINVLLKPSFNMGNTGIPWTEFYAIYPSPGLTLYGEGHACCGITAGRNGVAIWEHAKDSPVLALAAPAAIAGWSHIAILYSSGIPSVYINGKLAATGDKSNFIIHPSLGEASLQEGASF
ncbi:MAG TPA: glycosyl hydrolase, partial [Chitinophagaceae bacterium]|nr:glycosyl hydrolase [Chitinophagaceae bacterium]